MEYLCTGLQRGRASEYDEARLAVLEAGAKVDEKYLALRLKEPVYRKIYLDEAPIRGLYHGQFLNS